MVPRILLRPGEEQDLQRRFLGFGGAAARDDGFEVVAHDAGNAVGAVFCCAQDLDGDVVFKFVEHGCGYYSDTGVGRVHVKSQEVRYLNGQARCPTGSEWRCECSGDIVSRAIDDSTHLVVYIEISKITVYRRALRMRRRSTPMAKSEVRMEAYRLLVGNRTDLGGLLLPASL